MKEDSNINISTYIKRLFTFLIVLAMFFFFVSLLSFSFRNLGQDIVASILNVTANPFIGLFIGLLITAIIQSSSTSTSMVVAAVASGTLSLSNATPIIMGANIGTTITSTIISLGYITRKKEFKQAIAAGVIHDLFNIMVAAILFPLEYYYGFLSKAASELTHIVYTGIPRDAFFWGQVSFLEPIFLSIKDLINNRFALLVVAFVLVFVSIKVLSKFIYSNLIGQSFIKIEKVVFSSPLKSFAWGTLFTAAVQSSSSSTSLIVTLVATSKVTLKRAFQFIMGANIGTTLTAFLAAYTMSSAAISIALVHLLFNFIGVLLFMPFPFLSQVPIMVAERFSSATFKYRFLGFVYILICFFILPFTLISLNKKEVESANTPKKKYEIHTRTHSNNQVSRL